MADASIELLDDSGNAVATLHVWSIHLPADSPTSRRGLILDNDGRVTLVEASDYGYEITPKIDQEARFAIEPREFFEPDRPGSLRGRLHTANHVGIVTLRVIDQDRPIAFALIEIVSEKLEYETEYRWMLRDITADLAETALARFGPAQGLYTPKASSDSKTLYQRFAFLQAILESDEYQQALEQVLNRPYRAWRKSTRQRPISTGMRSTHDSLRALAARGPRRPLLQAIGSLSAVPHQVPEQNLMSTIDNIPNQFVRSLLEDWRELAQEVHDGLAKEEKQNSMVFAPVARGLIETRHFIDILDAILATSFFRGISRPQRVPAANEVLIRRPGYRELLRIQQQALVAASLSWDGADTVYGAGQRDVATLYEYWVFLQFGRLISELCGMTFEFSELFAVSAHGLQLNLKKRRAQVLRGWIKNSEVPLHIELWFNRPFKRMKGESWSYDLRPDFSLGIGNKVDASALERTWLHFDAKYRVDRLLENFQQKNEAIDDKSLIEPETRALREDLLKMHAYRDAVRRSVGAYVIYPGEPSEQYDELFLEYREILPGLGAFGLRPGEDGSPIGATSMRAFIEAVMRHFGDALSQDRRASYWTAIAIGQLPVPPSIVPSQPSAVSGLWFLSKPPADESVLLTILGERVRWIPELSELVFRIDNPSQLSIGMLSCRWVIGVTPTRAVTMFEIGPDAKVSRRAFPEDSEPVHWLAVKCSQSSLLPSWLDGTKIELCLGDRGFVFGSWARLVRELASN